MGNISDGELVRDCISGRKESFDMLYDRYRKPILSYVYRKVFDMHTSEEIVQDTFTDAFSSLSRCRNPDSFGGWLYAIARNKVGKWVRSRRVVPLSSSEMDGINADLSDQGEIDSRRELFERLEAEILKISDVDRKILGLKHRERKSCREIAEIMGMEVGTVTSRLARVYKKLRERLSERGDIK